VKFSVTIQAEVHAKFLNRSIDCSENNTLRYLVKDGEGREEIAIWKPYYFVNCVFLQVIDEQGRPLLADKSLTKVILILELLVKIRDWLFFILLLLFFFRLLVLLLLLRILVFPIVLVARRLRSLPNKHDLGFVSAPCYPTEYGIIVELGDLVGYFA
jgi:hypothetical protein